MKFGQKNSAANNPDETSGDQDVQDLVEESLELKIEALEKALADSRDQLLRRTADLDNMRRRHQQEREQLIYDANKRLIVDLLSVVDDLERTLEHAADQHDPMAQGIELVYKNFLKTLERYGSKPMNVVGETFDPMNHDALMEEPRTDVEAGMITREIQKGYTLGDSILRHAKVFVARSSD